jgi:putative Mn2+ efflux pump MntP
VLKLILFVLPLGLDTFAVSAALGIGGLPSRARLRVSVLMSSFEMAMPVVGLLVGHALGRLVGDAADYVAIGVLALLGVWMLLHDGEGEGSNAARILSGRGLVLLALGISISATSLQSASRSASCISRSGLPSY